MLRFSDALRPHGPLSMAIDGWERAPPLAPRALAAVYLTMKRGSTFSGAQAVYLFAARRGTQIGVDLCERDGSLARNLAGRPLAGPELAETHRAISACAPLMDFLRSALGVRAAPVRRTFR